MSLQHHSKATIRATRNCHQAEASFASAEKQAQCGTYCVSTRATASFSTLSPNRSVYSVGSTCSSWKMASTVTRTDRGRVSRTARAGRGRFKSIHGCSSPIILYAHGGLSPPKSPMGVALLRDSSGLPTPPPSLLHSAPWTFQHVPLYPFLPACPLLRPQATPNLP